MILFYQILAVCGLLLSTSFFISSHNKYEKLASFFISNGIMSYTEWQAFLSTSKRVSSKNNIPLSVILYVSLSESRYFNSLLLKERKKILSLSSINDWVGSVLFFKSQSSSSNRYDYIKNFPLSIPINKYHAASKNMNKVDSWISKINKSGNNVDFV